MSELLKEYLTILQKSPEYAACLDRSNSWHGWLFKRHPDGGFVSIRKLKQWEIAQAEDQKHYGIVIKGNKS